jgi:hypothetical protein
MTAKKLIELYGRRFTSSSKLMGLIAILIFGVLLAFNSNNENAENHKQIEIQYAIKVTRETA